MLGMYQPLRGTYGFRIITKGTTSATETDASVERVQEDYFTNRDMYGNTYAFYVPYSQQKVIDISEFLEIHSVEIHFYQDYNFADSNNVRVLRELLKEVVLVKEEKKLELVLEGKTLVITGSLNSFANRDELKQLIEDRGGKVSGSVSAKTSYLINNDVTSSSSKNKKAQSLGVPIISEEDFLKL